MVDRDEWPSTMRTLAALRASAEGESCGRNLFPGARGPPSLRLGVTRGCSMFYSRGWPLGAGGAQTTAAVSPSHTSSLNSHRGAGAILPTSHGPTLGTLRATPGGGHLSRVSDLETGLMEVPHRTLVKRCGEGWVAPGLWELVGDLWDQNEE